MVAVDPAVCAERQTVFTGHPKSNVPSQSESHRHEQLCRHPRARREVAGAAEVRLHCRGLTPPWKGRDIATDQFIKAGKGGFDSVIYPPRDPTEAGRGVVEPVGSRTPRELSDGNAESNV